MNFSLVRGYAIEQYNYVGLLYEFYIKQESI